MDVDTRLAPSSGSIPTTQVFIVPCSGTPGAGDLKVLGSASWELTVPLKQGVKKQNREKLLHPAMSPHPLLAQIITAQDMWPEGQLEGDSAPAPCPCDIWLPLVACQWKRQAGDFLIQLLRYI